MRNRAAAVLVIVAAAALTSCSTARIWADFGGNAAAPEGLTLTVISVQETQYGLEAKLRLTNNSADGFTYRAYGDRPAAPVWDISLGVAWLQQLYFSECGTGVSPYTLGSGQQVEFSEVLPRRLAHGRERVGVIGDTGVYVWSPSIDVTTRRWASVATN